MDKKNFIVIFFTLFALACETEPEIEISGYERQLVVEGWIDENKGAKILLTYTASYFGSIDSASLLDYSARTAKVTISAQGESEILTLKPNDAYFPPIYYFGSELLGKANSEFSLEVIDYGNTYTATTTIPSSIKMDSVWFQKAETDTTGQIWIQFNDNGDETNYYRTLTKVIGTDKRFVPTYRSVFTDELFNGQTTEVLLLNGKSSLLDLDVNYYFSAGDTIIVKLCSIDQEHYEFWKDVQTQLTSAANPFAVSNTNIRSNIEGGIGIWGGNAVCSDTIITE